MPKISVIVPVYNTEKYIEKCLDSIISQDMKDIEVIVVNDGSTDNSEEIIKKYVEQYPDKVKLYTQVNGGLSSARNYGISKATGKYLCFVDSDDYIAKNLFDELDTFISDDVDLIKYKCIKVDENGEQIEKVNGPVFAKKNGNEAFNELYSQDVLMEAVWLYLCKREFWERNNFQFPVNKFHEDWAVVPIMVISANAVVSTGIYGYCYVQSSNSITRDNDDEKIKTRVYDMLEHYDNLVKKISEVEIDSLTLDNYKIYMSNCLILKLKELPEKYHKEYIQELKQRRIVDNIKARNIKQLIKKILLKINVKLYLKIR